MSKGHPRISVRFEPETLALLKGYSEETGIPVADYIREAVCKAMAADADMQSYAESMQPYQLEGQTEIDF